MNKIINDICNKLKKSRDSMDMKSLEEIQFLIKILSKEGIDKNLDYLARGIELYRDEELGFVFTAYSEVSGTYRIPHNHGNGWVIYSVVEGIVAMGNYFNWEQSTGHAQLVLKDKINLRNGDVKIYYPGDIHDTKCISETALIVRLTSCDLKEEENAGRMKRFTIL